MVDVPVRASLDMAVIGAGMCIKNCVSKETSTCYPPGTARQLTA